MEKELRYEELDNALDEYVRAHIDPEPELLHQVHLHPDRFPGQSARDETDLAVREPAHAVTPERNTRDRNGHNHQFGSSRKRSSGSTILSSLLIFSMASSGSAKRKMMAALP